MTSESDTDGDLLLKNVSNIRKRLLHTERSLQMLQTPRDDTRYAASSDGDSLADETLQPLTLDDLSEDYLDIRSSDRGIRFPYSFHRDAVAMQGAHSTQTPGPEQQLKMNGSVQGSVPSTHDFENESLRKKLQALRDENSELVSSNHQLLNKLESTEYELRSTKTQLQAVSHELESTKGEVPSLRDRVAKLESSIRLDDEALRSADQKLVEYERELQEKDSLIRQGREETKTVRSELTFEMQQRRRAENQRDEAMKNLEDLSDQLNEYRNKTKEKFKKYQSTEDHLRDSLLHCDKEREELLEKATALEEELQDSRENFRVLREESARDLEASSQDLQSTISGLRHQLDQLRGELDTKGRENAELTELTQRQNERLADCQRDIEASHSELKRLEEMARKLQAQMRSSGDSSLTLNNGYDVPRPVRTSSPNSDPGQGTHPGQWNNSPAPSALSADQAHNTTWSDDVDSGGIVGAGSNRALIAQLKMKLAMKEAENQRLQAARQRDSAGVSLASSGTMDGLRSELTALVEKNKIGDRKAQELRGIINRLEEERTRHAGRLAQLQERLTEQEAHSTAVESQLDHYNAQLKILQDGITQKEKQVSTLEAELGKKNGLVAHLEEHLSEKTASIEECTSKLTELEQLLEEKMSELRELQTHLERKTEEAEQTGETLTKVKELHAQQCEEMLQQIESLLESKETLSTQLENTNLSIDEAQGELTTQRNHSKQLKEELDKTRRDLEDKTREHSEATHSLQLQVKDDAYRISQLEAALVVCKEELTGYIDRLDDMRDRHDKELQTKKSEIRKLEKQLEQARDQQAQSAEQVSELERALEERQQMLLQSTARLAELEDKEGQLEHQVSHLEKGLNHVTVAAEKDAALIEKKLHQACMDLEDRTSQLTEATQALSQAQADLAEADTRSADLELQLSQTKQDCDNHAAKATQLEGELREAKLQLENMTAKVSDLEGALETIRQENQAHREQSLELDGELNRAQLEVQTATKQLSELQRVLQRSRAEAKQKQQRMQELTDELRRSQNEARNREQDMAEMDEALKSSQRELQQRATQVSQLDTVVKEHRSEADQKILQLENSLSKSQYELKQCSRKIGELDDRCGEQQETLKERALQVQQLEQLVSRQKNEIGHKAAEITQLQKRIEELSQQCSSHREEELAQGQQLRLTREQMQRHHLELAEARRQLAQVQREKLAHLQESHAALLASKNQLEASHRLEISRLKDAEARGRQEAESLREKVTGLENELQARKEVIQAANEAIVIKEAEVARLNARISGYERATFGTQFTTHEPPNHSSSATPSRGIAPYLIPPLVAPSSPLFKSPRIVLRRSASDHNLPSSGIGVDAGLRNSFRDMHLQTGSPHRGNHSRHLTDTGYHSLGLYGSRDVQEPMVGYEPRDVHSRNRVMKEPASLGHFSDTDSAEDAENLETLQGMLAFVNRHIASQQQQDSAAHSHSPNPNLSSLTEHGHSLIGLTQEDSELALSLSEIQDVGGERWGSPSKGRGGSRTSAGSRGVSPSSKSPDRGRTQGHQPKIMKSTNGSPKILPLKKRLATQRAKLVSGKPSKETPLKPEDCMADLQDRLRANDERRRRIDDQLYNMRDHARKITNRILGKDPDDG
ncbi:coiled-coil domain-containing protein 18-like [Acanthaster planci]|uniref:Coiled-coil domain-containing protein 18-like n=1 Tax=Acanthaster planci TaxID=133434 RepID=A0A8B7ZL13_ACAPL|nr:coiled-coil domain-containing protein 18-like [Acanthaster planci]